MKRYSLPLLIAILIVHAAIFAICAYNQSFVTDSGRYFLLADDAMISMTYARNLFQGNGLVWQEGDRVMGITNIGWTLIMAGLHVFGLPPRNVSLPVIALGLLINLALLSLLFNRIQKLSNTIIAGYLTLWLALFAPLIFWSVHGFETALQTLLITLAFLPLIDQSRRQLLFLSPIIAALAVIVRPDGIIALAVILLSFVSARKLPTPNKRRWINSAIIAVLLIAALIAFQKNYYGDLLPNTYYLKTSGGARSIIGGVKYLGRWLFFNGAIFAGLLFLLRLPAILSKRDTRVYPTIFALLWICYVIWTGGDAFPRSRFLLPVTPILLLIGSNTLSQALNRWFGGFRPRAKITSVNIGKYLLLLALLLAPLVWITILTSRIMHGPDENRVDRVYIAEALRDADLPNDTKIAIFEAGTFPYLLPQFEYIDLLGKNDAHVARMPAQTGLIGHNKWDYAYSLGKLQPDLIIAIPSFWRFDDADAKELLNNGDDNIALFSPALWIDPFFDKYYKPNAVVLPTRYKTHRVFARKGSDIGGLETFRDKFAK